MCVFVRVYVCFAGVRVSAYIHMSARVGGGVGVKRGTWYERVEGECVRSCAFACVNIQWLFLCDMIVTLPTCRSVCRFLCVRVNLDVVSPVCLCLFLCLLCLFLGSVCVSVCLIMFCGACIPA